MEKYATYAAAYLAAISAVTVIFTVLDKRRASKGGRRIPESTLFLLAGLGGCAAEYAAMRAIRHKTKHKRFMLGLPCIFILQTALCTLVYLHFI